MTAAPAIAREVNTILTGICGPLELKDFNPIRKGIKRFRDMDWEERMQMVKKIKVRADSLQM